MKHLFLTAILLLSACISAHAEDEPTDEETYYKMIQTAENYLDSVPDSGYAHYLRGYAYLNLNRPELAVSDIAFAWEHNFTPIFEWPTIYRLYQLTDLVPEKVVEVFTPIERRLSDSLNYDPWLVYEANMVLARALGQSGHWRKAAEIYMERALETIPYDMDQQHYITVLNYQAKAWLQTGRPDKALQVMNRPEWEWTKDNSYRRFMMRSLALRDLGRLDEAVCYMDSVATIYPRLLDIIIHQASILEAAGQYDTAIDSLNLAINILKPQLDKYPYYTANYVDVLLRMGKNREAMGDIKGAEADYLTVLELRPDNLIALSRLHRRDEVLTRLADLPAPLSDFDLAVIYADLGDDDQALLHLGNAFARQTINPLSVPYNLSLRRLTALPAYPATKARFNPDN